VPSSDTNAFLSSLISFLFYSFFCYISFYNYSYSFSLLYRTCFYCWKNKFEDWGLLLFFKLEPSRCIFRVCLKWSYDVMMLVILPWIIFLSCFLSNLLTGATFIFGVTEYFYIGSYPSASPFLFFNTNCKLYYWF